VGGPIGAVDGDIGSGHDVTAQLAAWYLTGMGTVYAEAAIGHGFAGEVAAIREANPAPRFGTLDWPMQAEPLLEQLGAFGSAEEVAGQLVRWDECVDITAVLVGPMTEASTMDLVEAGAPRVVSVGQRPPSRNSSSQANVSAPI
jgi:hypothetical protein